MLPKTPLPIFPEKTGKRIWRDEVNTAPHWELDADEKKLGPRTTLPDGIYIVTVSEHTPGEWIDLSWKASVAAEGQHPGPNFLPADGYDSSIAVHNGRVVGGALAGLSCAVRYRWKPTLKADGTAYSYEELTRERGRPVGCPALKLQPTLEPFRPTVMTIWVHGSYRRLSIGRQLVSALAQHFKLPLEQIGFRLPLSAESALMIRAMGLDEIICGF